MPYKLSRCIAIHHAAQEQAVRFYSQVLGLAVAGEINGAVELSAAPFRIFIDKREPRDLVLELLVPDLEAARVELVAAGCHVIEWKGKGNNCFIRDPFGTMFNLWEDPEAFEK